MPKLRILLDLSMTLRGYCGIAQDARLLYKVLASCDEFDVTGLIYHPRKFSPIHKFPGRRATRADRVANHAQFLWALSEPNFAWPRRVLGKLRYAARIGLASRAGCDSLDTELHADVLWRLAFARTLAPEDLALVQRGKFLLANLSNAMIYGRALLRRRPLTLDTRGYDFFITPGAKPFRTTGTARQIVRHYDLARLVHPDTVADPQAIRWQHLALRDCARRAFFVCDSEPVREELMRLYPRLEQASATIPCALSEAYRPLDQPDAVRTIIEARRSTGATPDWGASPDAPRYILGVGTLEPRKNLLTLIEAYQLLLGRPAVRQHLPQLKLVLVGNPGWRDEPILAAIRGLAERGQLVHLEHVPAAELRVLYAHAEALAFLSHAEGFGIPPLEAMQCEAPVVASDIAVHRWVLGEAALYANPYNPTSVAAQLERLVASDERAELRRALTTRGRQRVQQYSLDRCADQWRQLFDRLQGAPRKQARTHEPSLADQRPLPRVA